MAQSLEVVFHGATLLVVEHNQQPYVPMKPVVSGMGLAWQSQLAKLTGNAKRWGITEIVMPTASGEQGMSCLPLRKLPGWLATISPNKVRPELREKVIAFQNEADDVLWAAWQEQHCQPTPYTVQPSDTLNEPQQIALRAMLESNVKRLPHEKQAGAMIKGWSKLKAHFGVPYRQIPAHEFEEALSIIARHVSEWELVEDAAKQPDAAPKLNAFMQALAAARENAMSYLNGFRKAVQAGQLGPRIDDIPSALLEGIVADALINSRFLAGFDQRTGKMHVQLVPHDASVFSFQSGDFGQAISAIPTKRLPELQDALSRRVAGHLAALQH